MVISGLGIDSLPGSSEVVITPDLTPSLFRAFMVKLNRSLKAYRSGREDLKPGEF